MALIFLGSGYAQQAEPPDATMAQVMKRLTALENENRRLSEELRSLKQELAAAQPAAQVPPAAVEERVDVAEQRVAEQAQTKVESSQKFPVSLNGMLLFNAFQSSKTAKAFFSPYYNLMGGPSRAGGSFGQSIVGLELRGPTLPGQGKVNASLTMDFWGAWSDATNTGWFRIREAEISMAWKRRTITVGQMKPLISPRQPTSLAEVATSPLAGAGNLWLWLPQARYEERVRFGSATGLNLTAALTQTDESSIALPYRASLQRARPAAEGRVAFWHDFTETRRVELASGFHVSNSHIAGASIPSRIASFDWSISPFARVQLTGSFYRGNNVASLGSLGNGVIFNRDGSVGFVRTAAGWNQVTVSLTNRLSMNLFGGIESDRGSTAISRNFTYATNLMYHLGPNVLFGAEALQTRLRYSSGNHQLVNHYDLALAYLF